MLSKTMGILGIMNLFMVITYIIYQANKGMEDIDLIFNFSVLLTMFLSHIIILINQMFENKEI